MHCCHPTAPARQRPVGQPRLQDPQHPRPLPPPVRSARARPRLPGRSAREAGGRPSPARQEVRHRLLGARRSLLVHRNGSEPAGRVRDAGRARRVLRAPEGAVDILDREGAAHPRADGRCVSQHGVGVFLLRGDFRLSRHCHIGQLLPAGSASRPRT